MVITDRASQTSASGKPGYQVIGTRPLRPDGVDKVTGHALFGADITLPGTLYGKVLRSPHAHAIIRGIDTSKAAALPGVRAVITHRDFPNPENRVAEMGETAANLRVLSNNTIAADKVLYRGHAVAAVAANTAEIAEQALALINVDYEVLPSVTNVTEAMKEDAPLVHPDQHTRAFGKNSEQPSNTAFHTQFLIGDPDAAFNDADVVVEREYTTQMVHQGYIEPHACSASWNADGHVTIWTSTQGEFNVREQVSGILGLPVSRLRVVPTEIGGGFGGKIPVYLEPLAAMLSKKAGAPVKMAMNRTEVFEATGPTSGTAMKVKVGAKRDGTIVAFDISLAYEAGAYPGSSVRAGGMCMLAPYAVENARIDCFDVVVNKPKTAAYRAPGAPAATFAGESAVDELALALGMDPIALRLKNASKQGTRQVTGQPFNAPIGLIECLEAARNSPHYQSPLPQSEGHIKRGRGIATGYWFNAGLSSACYASVNSDGTVSLVEGNPDIGGTRASLAMQLAETLGIDYTQVKPSVGDTDSVGYNDVTGGSRTTFATGIAVHEAGLDIQRQMIERARMLWQLSPEDEIVYQHGEVVGPKEGQRLSFAEIAGQQTKTGGPIVGRGAVTAASPGPAFAVQIADVEVDEETGKVDVIRYTAIQDAGTAIHPAYVEGQMQGGASQGVGWALNEEYFYDSQGRMVNSSFLDYRMPTTLDLPMIETIIVEVPNPGHPFGARGVGEAPIVPPLATIANAVSHALGHRFTDLPISPRRIVETLYNFES